MLAQLQGNHDTPMTPTIPLAPVVAVMLSFPGQAYAEGLLPLDMEALFCIGAVPISAAQTQADMDKLAKDTNTVFPGPSVIEHWRPLLDRMKAYVLARGITASTQSMTIGSALIERGKTQARTCEILRHNFNYSTCASSCIAGNQKGSGGNVDKFMSLFKSCMASCPGSEQTEMACSKVDACLKIGDRLPF